MKWGDKRYHTLDWELKSQFGEKVIKLSLDGGFTCPNRDGTIGVRGCIFCGKKGSGDFAGDREVSIPAQLDQEKRLLSKKWPKGKYIAYFQNFTNTYAPVSVLRQRYKAALSVNDVVGIAIATRPDCLPNDVLDFLAELADTTYLWVELGLQTIHPQSADFIRRGYDLDCFLQAVGNLRKRNIRTVVHLILGLPSEHGDDFQETVRFVAKLGIWGVKFHLLYIQRDTDLYQYYLQNPFPLLSEDQYVTMVVDALESLPPEVVIHRLTGDGSKTLLVGPRWSLHKLKVLSGIDREMARRNSYQGQKHQKPESSCGVDFRMF